MKTECTILTAGLPLSPGTYRLCRDIRNPKADGRIKQQRTSNWESWKVWPEGMEFIVDVEPVMPNTRGDNRIYVWGGYYKVNRYDPRFPALIDALEPVVETPSRFLTRLGFGSTTGSMALAVLDELDVPLDRIQAALQAIETREESER